jgi:hypothetical protein
MTPLPDIRVARGNDFHTAMVLSQGELRFL